MSGSPTGGSRRLTFIPSKEETYHGFWQRKVHEEPTTDLMRDMSSVWDRV